MSARNDLAADIAAAIGRFDPTVCDTPSPRIVELLAADLAQRWVSRPRVVTTAAELDALPVGAMLHSRGGTFLPRTVFVRCSRDFFERAGDNTAYRTSSVERYGPFWVWSPPAETDGGRRDNPPMRAPRQLSRHDFVSVAGHEFIGVAAHPDDDECTHRWDGTDATYCGLTRDAHISAETDGTER